MVEIHSVTKDVSAHGFRAVILNLLVALRSALWRQQIRAGGRPVRSLDVEILAIAGKIRQRQATAYHPVNDFVLEFQVAEAETMRPGAGSEIGAANVIASVVFRLIHLKAIGKERALGLDLRIVKAEKQLHVVGSHEIQAA